MISHFLNNFGWYMLLVELPSFLNKGLGFDIEAVGLHHKFIPRIELQKNHLNLQNALLSCLPFLCNWLFSIVYSSGLDVARGKGLINTTWARKLSMAIG